MAKNLDQRVSSVLTPPSSLIEVDERASQDQASEYKSTSITSSVLDYEFENGRRYHAYKAGSYPLPNDEAELERIDIKHHVIMLLSGGHLHLAPLISPAKILDLGTGTGIWAMEMADQYPDSLVIGTDLSPIQPKWYETIFHGPRQHPIRDRRRREQGLDLARELLRLHTFKVHDRVHLELAGFTTEGFQTL